MFWHCNLSHHCKHCTVLLRNVMQTRQFDKWELNIMSPKTDPYKVFATCLYTCYFKQVLFGGDISSMVSVFQIYYIFSSTNVQLATCIWYEMTANHYTNYLYKIIARRRCRANLHLGLHIVNYLHVAANKMVIIRTITFYKPPETYLHALIINVCHILQVHWKYNIFP